MVHIDDDDDSDNVSIGDLTTESESEPDEKENDYTEKRWKKSKVGESSKENEIQNPPQSEKTLKEDSKIPPGFVRLRLKTDLEGKEIESIVGPSVHLNTIIWLLKFKDRVKLDLVHGELMKIYFADYVIRFYERRICWLNASYNIGSCNGKDLIVDMSNCAAVKMFANLPCPRPLHQPKPERKRRRLK